jgi:uncharacterized damage-inducible protein DinB
MPPSASVARDLLLYMLWADRHMLSAVRPVTYENLTRDAGVSFGSLLGTMSHMVDAQRIWLSRFLGTQLEPFSAVHSYTELPDWIHGWEDTASGLEAFLAGLTDDQLQDDLTWTNSEGNTFTSPLWQAVIHLVNHSTYHRGQAASLLRQMGYQPPATDLIYYFIERAGG